MTAGFENGMSIQIDVSDIHTDIGAVSSALSELRQSANNISDDMIAAFTSVKDSVDQAAKSVGTLLDSMHDIVGEVNALAGIDATPVADGLENIASALGEIKSQMEDQQAQDLGTSIAEIAATMWSTFYGKTPKKKSNGGGKYLKKETDDGDGLLGIASNADMLAAGLFDLTAAWDAEAIAKAASTAAQWAQTAAVTAWNGICGVASAVTTAFGAAVNFLTSPITLVVLGIAALIAIVVLLVKNWDTVKAALITGWEAVKQAFSVAAEWFNSNVIQPLVGFFTGLWDQICVIVTNVTTFISTKFQEFTLWIQTAIANVQAVFMGIDAFLQGVFAVDWTTQFGAFGEVQSKISCFRKCCKGAMLPKADDPRRLGVCLKKD